MTEAKFFSRLNDLLRSELGTSPSGLPMFEWGWSEEPKYFHPALAVDDAGQAIFDSRCQCGLNIREDSHRDGCSGFIVREQRYRAVRLFDLEGYPDESGRPIRARWLLWRWKAPPPERLWPVYEAIGIHPGHYRSGAYEPCHSYNELGQPFVLCIPRDMLSSRDKVAEFNLLCIRAFQRRLQEQADHPERPVEERRSHQTRVQGQDRQNLIDKITDRFPMGNIPGRKEHVSFPSGSRVVETPLLYLPNGDTIQ